MLLSNTPPSEKRKNFKKALDSNASLRLPGAFSPLVALLIEEIGFDGVYISGAVMSAELGLPDIGLTTLSEVKRFGEEIASSTSLPTLIDGDTGFGEATNAARTVRMLEDAGICAVHFEDQVNPKRCGHLDKKQIVSAEEMAKKIKAASEARRDKNFLIAARTDARASEGIEEAIYRAKIYIQAGADIIFPEALLDKKEFEKFRKEIKTPLIANMTEFGKSELLNYQTLEEIGYNIIIYPVTTLRLAMKATKDGLLELKNKGYQDKSLLNNMQTREELYKLLRYKDYNDFDKSVFNFKLKS